MQRAPAGRASRIASWPGDRPRPRQCTHGQRWQASATQLMATPHTPGYTWTEPPSHASVCASQRGARRAPRTAPPATARAQPGTAARRRRAPPNHPPRCAAGRPGRSRRPRAPAAARRTRPPPAAPPRAAATRPRRPPPAARARVTCTPQAPDTLRLCGCLGRPLLTPARRMQHSSMLGSAQLRLADVHGVAVCPLQARARLLDALGRSSGLPRRRLRSIAP